MFNIEPSELLLVAVVALVVIGPKDLPRVMRVVGQWVGRARGMARHFRSGFDEMVRQAELEEMEKRWAAENARIMAEHPATPSDPGAPEPGHHEALPPPGTAIEDGTTPDAGPPAEPTPMGPPTAAEELSAIADRGGSPAEAGAAAEPEPADPAARAAEGRHA